MIPNDSATTISTLDTKKTSIQAVGGISIDPQSLLRWALRRGGVGAGGAGAAVPEVGQLGHEAFTSVHIALRRWTSVGRQQLEHVVGLELGEVHVASGGVSGDPLEFGDSVLHWERVAEVIDVQLRNLWSQQVVDEHHGRARMLGVGRDRVRVGVDRRALVGDSN